MTDESAHDRIADLLLRWEEAAEQGTGISIEELCGECPELEDHLRERIDALKQMAWMTSDCESHNAPLPEMIGDRYRVERLLGEGGHGRVLLAFDMELERRVAIKIPHSPNVPTLRDEAKRLAKLQHGGIVSVHDVVQDGEMCAIVSDFVDGENLADRLAKGPLPHGEAVSLIAEVADALQHAHEVGIVHRDIKPANILIDQHNKPHLTDFGIASTVEGIVDADNVGTLAYMAPEQIAGEKQVIGPAADIYSLGVVLYQCLTGRLPYPSDSPLSLRESILLRPPIPPSRYQPTLPNWLEEICLNCLSKHPADRIASAVELGQVLRSPRREVARRNLRIVFALFVVLLGLAVSGFYFPWQELVSDWDTSGSTANDIEIAGLPPVSGVDSNLPEIITNRIGMKLRLIPAGEFLMGSPEPEEGRGLEEKLHRVRITKPFYIGTTEVTQAQWERIMGTSKFWEGWNRARVGADYPALNLDWKNATEFCQKLSAKEGVSYRLPTEAEWEYACRAGSTSRFCFGDDEIRLNDHAWWGNSLGNPELKNEEYAHRAAQKKPNAWGLYDMHGNVWEWCQDWFDEEYYMNSPVEDPTGPKSGITRVLRGGSWVVPSRSCRSATRGRDEPSKRTIGFGFRVVREVNAKQTSERKPATSKNESMQGDDGLIFDGKTRIITNVDRTLPVTLEAWIKPDRYEGGRCQFIVGSDIPGKYGVGIAICGSVLSAEYVGGMINSDASVVPAVWSHIAGVFSHSETRLYLNGKLVASGPGSSTSNDGAAKFVIGNVGENNHLDYFQGQVRSVRISGGERYGGDFQPGKLEGDEGTLWLMRSPEIRGTDLVGSGGEVLGEIQG